MKQSPVGRESRADGAADHSDAPDRRRRWSAASGASPPLLSQCFTSSTLSRLFIISLFSLALMLQLISDVSARRSVVLAPNFSLSPPKANRARIQYKTTYACEHRELHLSCEPNEAIHLVRANYGRFSLSICNEGGRADLSVNCMSYRSFLIMTDRCMNKSSCSVVVSSQLFGDPCPGSAKYLEVQYHCVKGGASQSTKRPPEQSVDAIDVQQQQQSNSSNVNYPIQLPPLPPPLPSVPTTTYAPIAGEKDDESTASSVLASGPRQSNSSDTAGDHPAETSSSPSSTAMYPVPFHLPSTSTPAAPAPSTPIPLPLEPYDPSSLNTATFISVEDYCPSVFMRSLFWNWTQKGQVSTQKCPGGASGYVKWQCNFNPDLGLAEWFPMRPDFSECRSVWLDNLEERLNKDDESVIRISHELALMTLTKALYSDDLQRISHIIKLSLERAAGNVLNWHTIEVWHKHQMLKELLIYIVETISNLLGNAQDDAWLDLNIANRKDVASALIKSLESSALLLAENTNHDGSSAIAKANVLASVHVLDTRMPISLQFPTNEDTSGTNEWIRMEDSIFLPAQSLVDHSQNGLAKVAFFAYYRIEDLLKPSQHTDMDRFSSFLSTRLHNFSQSSQLSINSRVIGAAISHNGQIQHLPLSQPVTVVLRHIQDENIASPRCVYWNVDRQNWLTDGCWVEATNSTHTVCMCNHLTHFALLNEVKPASEAVVDGERMERNVALVGCVLALVILALVSVLIFLTPTGSTVSSSIHRNLCLTLFVSESIYLIALFGADIPNVFFFCLAFLHYFLMCSFFWTFFESFDIYMNVNSIYEHFKSSKRLYWYYIIAYISPAFICLTCFIVDANCYRNFANIWLRADNYLYLTLVGPAIGLALASLVFILFAYILTRNHVITTTTIKCFEDIRVGGSKSLIRWILLLLFFQGLNWSTALVYLSKQDSTVLAVLFALSSVATALFLAVFCVLKIENVQHSRLFRHLPFTLCQDESQLSSAKNSTTSDVYSTRPVVTQVTSTQVNGMNGLHGTPLGHSPSTPTATSPVSMSPCLPQSHPLPISQSTHWNCQQDSPKKSTALDHQSILAQQDPNCLLYSLNHMKTLPREFNPSFCGQEASMRNIEGMMSNKKRAKAAQANFEFASLHRPAGNLGNRKQFGGGGHENKYSVQTQGVMGSQFAPNLDHIYESIDSDQALYEHQRRLNMQNFYGGANNYRSKSTVNDDDLSSSSIYEDKPLLFANHNSTLSYDNHKSKRIFVPQHYHSNASIYDNKTVPYRETRMSPPMLGQDGLQQQQLQQQQQQQQQQGIVAGVPLHGQPSALWHFGKEPYELPDLLQKSGNASNLLVSYSGENRFLNKVVNSGKSTHAK